MAKKIISLDAPEKRKKTPVWWKLRKYFIHQENIRAIKRQGKGTLIRLYQGDDLLIDINYDKLRVLLPTHIKAI